MTVHRLALLGFAAVACSASTDDAITAIAAIQGNGAASPLGGRRVTVEGLVSGDFQDRDADSSRNLGGYFLRSERPDADAGSSEGLFVFEGGRSLPDVAVGDRVRVAGEIKEHYGETQLLAASVTRIGRGEVVPVDIELPVPVTENADGEPIADLERYEGMQVRFPQALTVTGLDELARFGALRLSAGGRLWQYTETAEPDPDGYRAHERENAGRSVLLDDGRRSENPDPAPYVLADAGQATRAGDTISGLVGHLRYARGSGGAGTEGWRLVPAHTPDIRKQNARPAPPAVPGSLKVASLNVLNWFTTVDDGTPACGPHGQDACRGADNALEQARQQAKLVATLTALDADIVGLVELENNERASLVALVDAFNTQAGSDTYAYVDTGIVGTDAIKTGLLYKLAVVRAVGPHAILDASVDRRFDDRRNRPALAQTFAMRDGDATMTVVVTHLKSKGSSCAADGDPNTGDGQGNCNRTRTTAAEALVDWLASDPTDSGDDDVLLIGDLNAYRREDPVRVFERAGYVNLAGAGPGTPYSFVHDGKAGALDHALASPSLASQATATAVWHINADEATLHDYNLDYGRDPGLFDGRVPFRSADHDPLLVGLALEP